MNGFDVVIAAVGVGGFLFICWLVVRLVNNRASSTITTPGTDTTTGTTTGMGTTGGTPPPPPPPPPPPGTGTTPPATTTTTTVAPPTVPAPPDAAMPPNEVMAMLRETNPRITGLDLETVTDTSRGYSKSKLSVQLDPSAEVVEAGQEMAKVSDVEIKTAGGGSITARQRPPTREQLREAGDRALARLHAIENAPT